MSFPIDFIRQILLQGLEEEHNKNPNFVGGQNQVNLFSFYEQLSTQEEVDRFTEYYRDLTNQQNRTGLIANGTIIAPENPTITNLNQCTIIPLSFTCSFRCTLQDRDLVLDSVNNIIQRFKGRKVDVAEFDNGKLFMVGTMGNNIDGTPRINNFDFVGSVYDLTPEEFMSTLLNNLHSQKGLDYGSLDSTNPTIYLYYEDTKTNQLYLAMYDYQQTSWRDATEEDIIEKHLPKIPEHNSFTKWQVSISFDSIRCDEPRVLNSQEYCMVSFGGSATIASLGVAMGNQMTKLGVAKHKVVGSATTDFTNTSYGSTYWLEPLELPSGNNANTQISNLMSNKFVSNTHTNALAISLQYTFMLDKSIAIIKQWFEYARYGTQSPDTTLGSAITPNMVYTIKEFWSCWGQVDVYSYEARIIESIDIENTESDTLTITIPFQIQGAND